MKKIALFVACVIVICFAGMLIFSTVFSNVWLMAVETEYIIPAESSIFSFDPLVMNSGSGDWWIYGKDGNNYYFTGNSVNPYIIISKKDAKKCVGFNPVDYKTWCY